MRRLHPLWRGAWLSLALTVTLTLLGGADPLSPLAAQRRMIVLFAAVAAGAFLAALPARLRRRKEQPPRARWQICLTAFLCGAAMALSLGLAGAQGVIFRAMEGSAGAWAFLAAALVSGFVTVRIAGRRAQA